MTSRNAAREMLLMKTLDRELPPVGTLQRTIIDTQALMGDPADNIPGVPGIGMKTASKLIARWGSLDALLLSAITGWAGFEMTPRIQGLLAVHARQALLSRELVWLYDRAPVAEYRA